MTRYVVQYRRGCLLRWDGKEFSFTFDGEPATVFFDEAEARAAIRAEIAAQRAIYGSAAGRRASAEAQRTWEYGQPFPWSPNSARDYTVSAIAFR